MEYQFSGPSVVGTRIAELLTEGWEPFFNVTIQELPQDQHIQEVAFGLYNISDGGSSGNENSHEIKSGSFAGPLVESLELAKVL